MTGRALSCAMAMALRVIIATLCGIAAAPAQPFPSQRIQIVVPFSPGTVLDSLARIVGERFSREFDQPTVVVNRLGAAGMIAFGEVGAAPADGHTLLFSGQTPLTVQPHVKAELPYRPDDFVPVCQMFETPFALVVAADAPFKDFAQFAAAARARPGAIRFGHPGVASFPHLLGALLGKSAGFSMIDVPYRSTADQLKDVIGGTIETTILSIGSFSPAAVRVIAAFSSKRSLTFPDVQTVAELGHPLPLKSLNGLFARRDTPPAVLAKLQNACAHAFRSDEFREAAARFDVPAALLDGEAFARELAAERETMKALIATLGLKRQ
jgi:tripartite-type tricarboxylate transporter receptor subunit TctC